LVAFAGPFMNVVFAFAIATLIYFVGLPGAGSVSQLSAMLIRLLRKAGWGFCEG